MNDSKKIIICTGGTGGHVLPAVNFANFLIKDGYDCIILLDKRGKKFVKNFRGKIYIINSSHLSGNIFFKFKSLISLLIGFFQSFIIIIKFRPSKCISFGSYATFMPLLTILIFKSFTKINLYIHEQNSIIGKVNLFFLKYAEYIFTNFDYVINLDRNYLYKSLYVGLPLGAKTELNFSKSIHKNHKKIIFIYGGSQGAINLIKNFLLMINKFDSIFLKKFKLVIQSPKQLLSDLEQSLNKLKIDYIIKDFYNNMSEILSITDIAVTRAGAGTINDLIRYRIPSIIFPLPGSMHNHQFFNAKYLADKNGAILIDENNFNVDSSSAILNKLINNITKQQLMKKALNEIIIPDANQLMLKKILYENKK